MISEIITKIFWTPFPIAIAILFLIALWGSKKVWAKIGLVIYVAIIILNSYYWQKSFNAKVTVGRQKAEAILITKLTAQIGKLIENNRKQKALDTITKFNSEYPLVAGDPNESKKLIDDLMKEAP